MSENKIKSEKGIKSENSMEIEDQDEDNKQFSTLGNISTNEIRDEQSEEDKEIHEDDCWTVISSFFPNMV